jgi:transcriptional regulator with XRE-family HTH domain
MSKRTARAPQAFPHKPFGDQLRSWRTAVHLSQHDLAQKADVTNGFIAHVETGRSLPSARKCEAIADAVGIPVLKVLHAAGHVSREYQPSDDDYLEPELRLFFRNVWPKMSEDEQGLVKDVMGIFRARVERQP